MHSWSNKKSIIIVVIIVAIIVLLILIQRNQRKKWEEEKKGYLSEQQRLKEELEPLMEEARMVMRGEKMATGALALYNFEQDGYENIADIDVDVDIIVAEINGNEGTLVVEYHIHRLDDTGKKVSWNESLGTIWRIEKEKDGSWVLVDTPYPEGGEDAMKEVEKLTKKLRMFKEENALISIEDQIEIFAESVDEWSDITGYFCFAVADLDQDGRLELIISTIQGSASYSYTDYYVIEDKKRKLMKLQGNEKKGDSPAVIYDFLVGKNVSDGTYRIVDNGVTYVTVYYDEYKGIYHYIHHDYSGHTPYETFDILISLSLENNIICEKILAYKKGERKEPSDTNIIISYTDNEQNEISEAEYKKIPEDTYIGCRKMEMCWQWNRIEAKEEIQSMNKTELKKLLMESYKNFEIKDKAN